MRRRRLLLSMLMLAVSTWMLTGCGAEDADTAPGAAAEPQAATITLGYVDWAEDVAVTHLMKVLLERHFGYDVELKMVDAASAFQGVASGKLDAFLDVWLPHTHANYWREYKHQVVDLGRWYTGTATLGIAVPDYVDAQTIADLQGKARRYGGKIYGIESGAGIMRLTQNKVIPEYGLSGYDLVAEDTSDMIATLDQAIEEHQPIAFTAWQPHWMFTAYPIRYLKDPHGTLSNKEYLHVIVREGFADDAPVAKRLLDEFQLTPSQLGTLELAIDDARSVYGGVRAWLKDNMEVVTPWLAAASEGRGGHPY